MTYYFNNCILAENVFPDEDYKLHKNILLVGEPGTGKTMIMQIFSDYLRATNNENYFRNISMTQLMNYHKVYGHIDKAMTLMKSYFASIPYPEGGKDVLADMQKNEYYYETVFYIVLSMMNVAVLTQVKSCRGRADAVMFSSDAIFIFEIKINKSAKEALAQIDDKGYMVPFEADGRRLVKIGISFSTETRTIEEWAYETVEAGKCC